MKQRYYYIYIITKFINKRSYVGSRFYDFKEPYWGSSKCLTKEINEIGLWNFSKEIIGIYPFIDKYERYKKEGENMILFNTIEPFGYNKYDMSKSNGWGNSGCTLTNNHKHKLSISNKGKNKGKKVKSAFKKGNIPWNKGRSECFSVETIQKMSIKKKGRTYEDIYGKEKAIELKEKRSIIRKELNKILTKCPYCGKQGGIGPLHRWHFKNCKCRH